MSQLLLRWTSGDAAALGELMPMVYNELRRLGRSALRRGSPDSVLPPTALVHEAWVRLAGGQQIEMRSRHQFYGLAAKIMRNILVDHTRRRRAAKRGGSRIEISLNELIAAEPAQVVDFLILDEALTRLGGIGTPYQQIVELRYMAGLTIPETAEVLNVSHATIERE